MNEPPVQADSSSKPRRTPVRDAATLVIVDRSGSSPRVLMGRRRPDQVFLPDKYVFPGGRVERADRTFRTPDTTSPPDALSEVCRARLALRTGARPRPSLAAALALAAIRETFEETGIVIGRPLTSASNTPHPASPWAAFLATGHIPALAPLTFFARAITPPGRPRRYDTRFFLVDATAISFRAEKTDGELTSLDWFTLTAVQGLDLPNITRRIMEDLAERFAGVHGSALEAPVPFYFSRNGSYQRVLLSRV